MGLSNTGKYVAAGITILIAFLLILLSLANSGVTLSADEPIMRNATHVKHQHFRPNSLASSVSYFHRPDIRISCALRNFSPLPLPITALASVAGSGNTWSRQIIELITGIYTGAVYHDKSLSKIFKGEGTRDWSVVAVKIHGTSTNFSSGHCEPLLDSSDCDLKRVIIVIRHPVDAALAEYKRQHAHSHTKDAKAPVKAFKSFYENRRMRWENFHKDWLENSRELLLDVFILYYADLRDNLTKAIANLAFFIGVELDGPRTKCLLDQYQGYFHREGKTVNLTMIKESNSTESMIETVRNIVVSCVNKKRCATSGSVWHL